MASFRLAVLGMLFTTLGAGIAFILIYVATFHAARSLFEPIINTTRDDLLTRSEQERIPLSQALAEEMRSNRHSYFALTDADGIPLGGNIAMPPDPLEWQTLTKWDHYPLPPHVHEIDGVATLLGNSDVLFIGENATAFVRLNERIAYLFAGIFSFTIALGLLAASLIAFYSLKRVTAISQTAQDIMAGDLSQRIRLYGVDDELDFLTTDLNEMLTTMEILVENTQQVTNDIAHDLRSPLSKLRDQLAGARRVYVETGGDVQEVEHVFSEAIQRLDDIFKIFDALLRIAEIEAGAVRGLFLVFDVSALCRSLIDSYEAVAEDEAQVLVGDLADDVQMSGDKALIAQMLVNVIENAIRYSPPGTLLQLSLEKAERHIIITMSDGGPGIPVREHERVFQRFVRLDTDRGRKGNGLGLPMVKAITGLHEGNIRLLDNHPGLVVQITLPVSGRRPVSFRRDAPIANTPEYNAHLETTEENAFHRHRVMQRFPRAQWPRGGG
ncbi:MAG: HAMP domain-containing sensor histidine kinase [Acidocella sp.]|nr:HAMP domain-containing sensor histidine kinase [Acidocella sp.]